MSNPSPAIIIANSGFYFDDQSAAQINWSSIRSIKALKFDLITTDEVRLLFELDEPPYFCEVSEEQPGFDKFRLFVEKRFAFPENWWGAILKPAFARNETTLFLSA